MRGGAVMVDGVETVTGRRAEDAVTVQGRMPQAGPRPHREREREERAEADGILF